MQAGTVQGAHSPGGGGLPALDPDNFESDWTASLIAPPTGWAAETGGGETYTYTATGAYSADIDGTTGIWSHVISRDISALTLVVGYTINAWGNFTSSAQLDDGADGVAVYSQYETTDAVGSISMVLDLPSGWPGSLVALDGTEPTGFVIVAGTFFQNGDRAFYRFDDDGAATLGTLSADVPIVHSLASGYVNMQNYDLSNSIAGTPGDIRIHHTYLGFDEELDITAITGIVTGWGWT